MKKFKKLVIRAGISGLLVLALYFTTLAYPQVAFRNSVKSGTVLLYYNGNNHEDMANLAAMSDWRLQGSPLYDATRTDRVFYFRNGKIFSFFARLSFLSTEIQGFNLSIFGNSFINGSRIDKLREYYGGEPRFSIYEGDPSHIVAHEIAHQYLMDRIGRETWRDMPHWKREGIPEYMANIGPIASDSLWSLKRRVDILNNPVYWKDYGGWDRIHYEAELMVEYLIEIRGLSLEKLVESETAKRDILRDMKIWANSQR